MKRYKVDFYDLSGEAEHPFNKWERMYIEVMREDEIDEITISIMKEKDYKYCHVEEVA